MVETKKSPATEPFFVRQAGLPKYGAEGKGAIVGFQTEEAANADRDDRNRRAKEMGLKATYEVVAN